MCYYFSILFRIKMLLGFPEVGDAGGEAENAFDPSQKIREQNRKDT